MRFHHYPDNDRANCGLPPWTNNKRLSLSGRGIALSKRKMQSLSALMGMDQNSGTGEHLKNPFKKDYSRVVTIAKKVP